MRRVFRDYLVLLVCEQKDFSAVQPLLRPIGFGKIHHLTDAQQASEWLVKNKPDLVVAARSLPGVSGIELLAEARQGSDTKGIPFIIFGDRYDRQLSGPAGQVHRLHQAKLVGLPINQEVFTQVVISLLAPLIDTSRENAYALMDEAAEKAEAGRLEEAVDQYTKALSIYDSHLETWLTLAELLVRLKSFDQAEKAFLKALELNRYALPGYYGLVNLYENRKDFEQAIGVLRQALGIALICQMPPQTTSRITLHIGQLELRGTHLDEAEQAFKEAVDLNPTESQLRVDIGDAFAEQGYYSKAESHYQAALNIDPNIAHVLNKLAIAYRRQQQYDKAIELYNNALRHHPDDENLLFNIARTHYELGQAVEAQTLLEMALKIAPDFKEAKLLMAKLSDRPKMVIELDA